MSPFFKRNAFDASKCVSLLERTHERIGLLRKKRLVLVKQSRDDVAKLLQRGQDANAVARVEHVFKEENIASAYELLEQYCQIVIKGTQAIRSDKECSAELKEAIASLIYAAPRCGDLQELQKIRDIFIFRYGPQYVAAILDLNQQCAVNTQVIQKLSARPPNSETKLNLLKAIALEYKIDWNYQRAAAASFKTGESSEKRKVSPNVNQASKQGLADNRQQPLIPVNAKPKEPAANLAAQTATPTKAGIGRPDPPENLERNRSLIMINSTDKPKHRGQVSTIGESGAPTVSHDISPRQRDIVGANKSSSMGFLTIAEESMHEVTSRGNASLPAHKSAASTFQRVEPRKKSFLAMTQASSADEAEQSLFSVHQYGEQKGRVINASSSPTLVAHSVGASPTMRSASVFASEDYSLERANSAMHGANGNKAFPSKVQVSPLDASVLGSPPELAKWSPMQQSTSVPAFYQEKAFARKAELHSVSDYESKVTGESLVAKQYAKAHQSFIKVDEPDTDEDARDEDLPQAVDYQPKKANSTAKSYRNIHHQAYDYRNSAMATGRQKASTLIGDASSSIKAMGRKEASTFIEDQDRGQLDGTCYQRDFNADIHERSRGWSGEHRTPIYAGAERQHGSLLTEQQKHSTAAGALNARSSVSSELRSMKMEVDQELEELESTFVEAACTAMDMVCGSSTSLRRDVGNSQRDFNFRTCKSSASSQSSEKESESNTAFHNSSIQNKLKADLNHTEPHQEQETVALDAEMPHFDEFSSDEEEQPITSVHISSSDLPHCDDFSSDDSDEEEPPLIHNKDRPLIRNTHTSSPDQHSSSQTIPHQSNLLPFYHTRLYKDVELGNARLQGAALPSRYTQYDRSNQWDKEGDTERKLTNEDVDKGVLRWQGSSTTRPMVGDVGKAKWTVGNVQHPPSYRNYMHQVRSNDHDNNNMAGRHHGVGSSVRSVRCSKLRT